MEIESCLQKKGDYSEDGVSGILRISSTRSHSQARPIQVKDSRDSRLHKDYSSLWAYSTPSPNRSSFSSPMYSPPSSGAGSPVSAFSSSPLTSPFSHPRSSTDSLSEVPDLDPSSSNAEARQERTIIESELWLLTWQAQEDANLPFLCRDDVVNAVLSYLALAPSPDYRIGRVLRRLACSRPSIDSLLSMQFHTRVLHTLCMVPCRVVRYAKRCSRCERAAEFGREILREFASHVDSDFGNSFLIKRLSNEDFTTRVVAAIAKVALIRDRFRLGRMTSGCLPALDLLFDSLHSLLTRDDFLEISDKTTYSGGPPICAQIVGAISTLVSSQRLRYSCLLTLTFRSPIIMHFSEILDADAAVRPQERGECLVEKFEGADCDVEMLIFNTQEGELLARVPMDAVCEGSQYFQGMFTSDLQEKFTKRRTFVFCPEEEDCSAEDFTRFLHHLSGCRAQCSLIHSAQACVAMIKLSDRYLCPALSEYVCSPHGPARRLLNGETLPVFLPAVLTAQTHERLVAMCLLTLIRYCTSSQIVAALRSVSHSSLLVDSFIEQLKAMTSL
ncbi:hypothetical protein Aduo_001557 [Ancylostoma duodenale]